MSKARKASGNMLFLVVMTIGFVIAAAMSGLMMSRLMFERVRAQARLDAFAVSLANTINRGNRIGQLNNLEADCRELVHVSRQNYDECGKQDSQFLAPLCYQLLNEARNGQELLERERQNQLKMICSEMQETCETYNSQVDESSPLKFCWMKTSEPRIDSLYIGRIADTASNVKARGVVESLAQFDRAQNYVEAQSQLFKGGINAKLPEDPDLAFQMSSLAADVDGYSTPSRNANPDVFIPIATLLSNGSAVPIGGAEPLPNAVEIVSSMKAGFASKKKYETELKLLSIGVTGGDTSLSP